jgi:hypothetical protein
VAPHGEVDLTQPGTVECRRRVHEDVARPEPLGDAPHRLLVDQIDLELALAVEDRDLAATARNSSPVTGLTRAAGLTTPHRNRGGEHAAPIASVTVAVADAGSRRWGQLRVPEFCGKRRGGSTPGASA